MIPCVMMHLWVYQSCCISCFIGPAFYTCFILRMYRCRTSFLLPLGCNFSVKKWIKLLLIRQMPLFSSAMSDGWNEENRRIKWVHRMKECGGKLNHSIMTVRTHASCSPFFYDRFVRVVLWKHKRNCNFDLGLIFICHVLKRVASERPPI
jgi:hypothetical protein